MLFMSQYQAVGRGSFGVVHKANWRNEIVAVKIIEIDQNHEEIQKEVSQISNSIDCYWLCMND